MLFISLLFGTIPAFGQGVVLSEDFEGSVFPPSGWTVIDNDGDGHSWQTCADSKWVDQFSPTSKQLAISFCVDTSSASLTPYAAQDNWLVSPQIEVKNDAYVLEFVYAAQNVMDMEPIEILISDNGGTSVADFISVDKLTAPVNEDDVIFQTYTKSLSAYKDKTIRFAIRHKSNATYGLSVDDIYVYNYNGPLPPTFTSASGAKDGTSVTLGWTNPENSRNGKPLEGLKINVYRDGEKIAAVTDDIVPGDAYSWTDKSVASGNTYVYRLKAETSEGESPFSAKKATITVGIDIPKKVTKVVSALNDGIVSLQWDAVTAGANSGTFDPLAVTYNVYRISGTTPAELIAEGLKTTKWTDTEAKVGNNRYYVTAVNPGGESAMGDITNVTLFETSLADLSVAPITTVEAALNRLPDVTSKYSVYQTIFTPADLNYVNGDIKKLVFKSSSYNGTGNMPATIYLTPTDLEAFSETDKQWAPVEEADCVFNGTIAFEGGVDGTAVNDVIVELDNPFTYDGGNFVLTYVKNNSPSGAFADRYLTADLKGEKKTFTTSTYDPIDVTNLPHSTYSDKVVSEVPSIRFIVETRGMATLRGTVTNQADNRPVANAVVKAAGAEGVMTTTDAEGGFLFKFIPVSATALNVSAQGYNDITLPVSLTEGGATTVEVKMTEKANYTLRGRVITDDTGKAAAGATVTLGGYSDATATVGDDGLFIIEHVYSGQNYTLSVSYPTYDIYTSTVNNTSESEVTLTDIVLVRSLIPPFALDATIATDGSQASLEWRFPTDRDVESGWKAIGDPSEFNYTGGSYYGANFNIGHYFSVENLKNLKMAGLSVDSIRVYIKKQPGKFYAKVWQGNRENPVELAAQEIPDDMISAEGGWVTVKLDNPVELREGKDYIIGANAALESSSSDVFGQAKGSYISGGNNIKWGESPYDSNGYSTWCVMAYCNVPGTEADIVGNAEVPDCEYNVYRKESKDTEWIKLNSSPLRQTEYTDPSWVSIPAGEYTYAVSAIYKNGESEKAVSLPVSRSINTDVGVIAFVSPVKSSEVRDRVSVEVQIANFGELPVSNIPVSVSLNGEAKLSAVYSGEQLMKGGSAILTVGELQLEEGVHTIVAATMLDGDESDANNELSLLLPNLANVDLMGYRWDAYGDAGFMRVPSNNPEGATYLAEVVYDDALLIAAEHVNGTIYAFTATWYGEPRGLVTINPLTWTVDRHFPNQDDIYDYVLDMTYDGKTGTMFALVVPQETEGVDLVKVNIENGSTVVVGNIDKVCRTLAADMDGNLYMIDSTGTLFSVDPETAAICEIGDTGAGSAAYLQSMAFDHNTGRLFWAHTSDFVDGEIYEIDPATGSATRMGVTLFRQSQGCELIGLYTPFEYPAPSTSAIGSIGIDETAAPDSEVRYFDINGLEVKNPQPGSILIRVEGTNTTKVVIK